MLSNLLAGHASLREIASAIEALVRGSPPDDRVELERLRWSFTREFLRHLGSEERAVVALLADPRPEVAAVANAFRSGLQPLHTEYQHYMVRWQGFVARTDWAEYGRATIALFDRLRLSMAEEESRLYSLLPAAGTRPDPLARAG